MKRYYECSCHTSDHTIYVEPAIEPGSPQFDSVMVGVQLAPLLPWYKRIRAAIRYVVNPHGDYTHWHDTLLSPERVADLHTQLGEFLAQHSSEDIDRLDAEDQNDEAFY